MKKRIDGAIAPKPSRDPLPQEKTFILKALVGSRGYGVFSEDADYDYRGVYVLPTQKILSLGYRYRGTHWIEDKAGGVDDTAYELGHFLQLAVKCNPTILNTLKAPVVKITEHGEGLRKLFPYFLDMQRCYDAFKGYGLNQRKKMLNNKDNRWHKYGAAYARQLWYLLDLFGRGDYDFIVKGTEIEHVIREIKAGKWSSGEIIDRCNDVIALIDEKIKKDGWAVPSVHSSTKHSYRVRAVNLEGGESEVVESVPGNVIPPTDDVRTGNLAVVNKFLLKVRRDFWS